MQRRPNRPTGVTPAYSLPVTIATTNLPSAEVSYPYSYMLVASNGVGAVTFNLLSAVPDTGSWLSLSPAGALSGTPGTAETETLQVQATDSIGRKSAIATLSLPVAAAISVTTSSLPNATLSTPYSVTLTSSGGVAPVSWSGTVSPNTGGWATVNPNGTITGTPGTAETESVTVTATDLLGYSASKVLSLAVTGSSLSITTASLPNAQVGSAYSFQMSVAGGIAPYAWNIESAAPNSDLWEYITGAGVLSGTPQNVESETLVIRVTDSVGSTTAASFNQTVSTAASGSTGTVKFNPGMGIQADTQFAGLVLAEVQAMSTSGPGGTWVLGSPYLHYQTYYDWGSLDPGPNIGANNIAKLATDFNTLQQYCPGCHFNIVFMMGRSNAGGYGINNPPSIPSDILNNPGIYGAGPNGGTGAGWGLSGYQNGTPPGTYQIHVAAIWRPAVINRFLTFLQAVANYSFVTNYGPYAGQTFTFDTHPLIEAFFDGMENSYNFFLGPNVPADWSASAQDACYQQEMTGAVAAFPHTMFATFQSFGNNTTFPDPLLPGVIAYAAANRNNLSNSDVNGSGLASSAQHIYCGQTWNGSAWVPGGTDYRGQMGYLATIQPGDYKSSLGPTWDGTVNGGPNGAMQLIYNTCATLRATHIYWTSTDEKNGAPSVFIPSYVTPFCNTHTVPNTSKPTNLP